jgi:hypothetical protein
MKFLGRGSYIHACGRRWGSADALLYGVLETCARSRTNLRQILTSWSVFSYRAPAKIGWKPRKSRSCPPFIQATEIWGRRPRNCIVMAEGARRVHAYARPPRAARRRVRTARGACGRLHTLLRHDARQ